MAAPVLLETYPADGDTGIPVGITLTAKFDQGIDYLSLKNSVVLFGPDFDQTSGAWNGLHIDSDTGNNPFYLKSPGFKGLQDLRITVSYYDLATGEPVIGYSSSGSAADAAYGLAGVGTLMQAVPVKGSLAPDTTYTWVIIGDPDNQNTGVSSKSIYSVEPGVGNTSDTGLVFAEGFYTGVIADSLVIEITTAGDIGVAKYKYYLLSEGLGTAVHGNVSNRRYRQAAAGVQLRFSGTSFSVGDTFTVPLEPAVRLAASTKIVFTTNDGSYSVAPDSPSTPAESLPPSSTIPPIPGVSTVGEFLQIESMAPAHGSYNVNTKTKTITVLFDRVLEPSSVTDESIKIYKYPALGWWEGQQEPVELLKKITVVGQQITVEI